MLETTEVRQACYGILVVQSHRNYLSLFDRSHGRDRAGREERARGSKHRSLVPYWYAWSPSDQADGERKRIDSSFAGRTLKGHCVLPSSWYHASRSSVREAAKILSLLAPARRGRYAQGAGRASLENVLWRHPWFHEGSRHQVQMNCRGLEKKKYLVLLGQHYKSCTDYRCRVILLVMLRVTKLSGAEHAGLCWRDRKDCCCDIVFGLLDRNVFILDWCLTSFHKYVISLEVWCRISFVWRPVTSPKNHVDHIISLKV